MFSFPFYLFPLPSCSPFPPLFSLSSPTLLSLPLLSSLLSFPLPSFPLLSSLSLIVSWVRSHTCWSSGRLSVIWDVLCSRPLITSGRQQVDHFPFDMHIKQLAYLTANTPTHSRRCSCVSAFASVWVTVTTITGPNAACNWAKSGQTGPQGEHLFSSVSTCVLRV